MVGVTGLEPASPASRTQCAYEAELHYEPVPRHRRFADRPLKRRCQTPRESMCAARVVPIPVEHAISVMTRPTNRLALEIILD